MLSDCVFDLLLSFIHASVLTHPGAYAAGNERSELPALTPKKHKLQLNFELITK